MKNFIKLSIFKVLMVFVVIGLDLLSKHLFYKTDANLIPELLGFRNVPTLNTGGAWGILSGNTYILIAITVIILLGFCIFDLKLKKTSVVYSLAVSFLIGGAVGNLIDRIALGGVRDFIYFQFMPNFPTFNVADSFIFTGVVLLFIYIMFLSNFNKKTNEKQNKN